MTSDYSKQIFQNICTMPNCCNTHNNQVQFVTCMCHFVPNDDTTECPKCLCTNTIWLWISIN